MTQSITSRRSGSDRPNALFTPLEVVVDAMMLTEGRNREGIVLLRTIVVSVVSEEVCDGQ